MTNEGAESPDAVARFATQLRELRTQAGSPTFRQLAKETHYSASTLAEATAGRRLPTEAVTAAFARACGGDADEWVEKLRAAAAMANEPQSAEAVEAVEAGPDAPRAIGAYLTSRRWPRMVATVAGACCLLVIGALVGAAMKSNPATTGAPVAATSTASATSTPTTHATVQPASDGEDPIIGGCTADARLVDKAPLMLNGAQIGALEFKYSAACGAGWARAYLYPGQASFPLALVTVKAADGRQSSIGLALVKQVPVYTNVITPGAGKCLSSTVTAYPPNHAPITAILGCEAP